MKQILSLAIGAWLAGAVVASAAGANYASDQADVIENGHYQAVIADCSGCHTRPGGKYLAGGDPIETPFGTLVPPNITMDPTGIGAWSKADFRNAMKTGIGHDGKRLYPAMPYTNYQLMPDKDIDALWSYLQTVTPVQNEVKANRLPFPFNQRIAMLGWNMINFTKKDFKPDPDKSAEFNRGAYLVEGPGHCSTCHTAKTMLGADKSAKYLQGAELQGWYAPDITNDAHTGIGSWSEDQIVAYLKTGTNGASIAAGPMKEAVEASTSKMSDADLKAIAVYLKGTKGAGAQAATPLDAKDARMVAGAAIYRDTCSACHGGDGAGASKLFPALKGDPAVQQPNAATMMRVVLGGVQGAATGAAVTAPGMPALGWKLNDTQVADVLTYVRNSWGNAAAPVDAAEVKTMRKALGR